MHFIDWSILVVSVLFITAVAVYTKRYTTSVADFLAADRCAGRYMLCVAGGMSSLGAISIVAMFEMYYAAGFTAAWWKMIYFPASLLIALSGWVSYRFRETRAMTLAQFFEMRYSRNFRVFAGILAWVSGIINFGIFPAVGARFFLYFCDLPETVPGLNISTYSLIMVVLLSISLFFVFLGGQIAVMVTDFIQGIFTSVVFLIIICVIFSYFDWSDIIWALKQAPDDSSLLDPFHTAKLKGFNIFYFLIGVVGTIYGCRAWQGSQGYACSAKNAHEAKMGTILGEWRGIMIIVVAMLLPIGAYVVMHHPDMADTAKTITNSIAGIHNPTIRRQMTVPVVLAHILPVGVVGLFAATMMAAFISTHDTYLHSWGSIFIQDVILPFRKKPFSTRTHFWLLRGSILFVAIFIFMFSMLFKQNEYILMFFSITGAIYIGGAGAVIIGGLYWRKGSTMGAWVALSTGCLISIAGLVLRQVWPGYVYPWMSEHALWALDFLRFSLDGVASLVPSINWKVCPEEFPMNSQWIYFFTMVLSMTGYIAASLLESRFLKKRDFNLDKLLHRGEYAIKGEHESQKIPTGFRALLPSLEFTGGDRVIYYGKLVWTVLNVTVFVVGTIWYFTWGISLDQWTVVWKWYLIIMITAGSATTIWFAIGGIVDLRSMLHTLKNKRHDSGDIGMVTHSENDSDSQE
jgi:SSS family solute:Na+ symporter